MGHRFADRRSVVHSDEDASPLASPHRRRGSAMAETVSVEGEQYLRRSPWGAWGLALVTIGIYGLYWFYKINDEARRYLKDDSINPTRSLLAVFPGFLLIVPPFIAIWNTAKSIDRMEEGVGMVQRIQPILGLIASFVYSLHVVYYQS